MQNFKTPRIQHRRKSRWPCVWLWFFKYNKGMIHQKWLISWTLLKLKISALRKTLSREWATRQATDWQKIFAKDTCDKGLLSKIYKEFLNSIIKKQPDFFLNGQRPWTDKPPKKIQRWQICKWRDVWHMSSGKCKLKQWATWTSLVVQWLRIRLPMQGTRVRALVWEDPTCRGATKPRASQLLSLRSRARVPQLLKPACLESTLRNKRSHCNEKPTRRNEE